jgi:hypothetical protein
VRRLPVLGLTLLVACGFNSSGKGLAASLGDDTATGGSSTGADTTGATTTSSSASTSDSTTEGGTTPTVTDSDATTADDSTSGSLPESSTGETGTPVECHPLVVEVLVSLNGSDPGREWVKLYNPCPEPLPLATYVLGWGRGTLNLLNLQGSIAGESCFVVGGPVSDNSNFNPPISQAHEFNPQLYSNGRAVMVYQAPIDTIDDESSPVDTLIYGDGSGTPFPDPEGEAADPYVGPIEEDSSYQRTSLDREFDVLDPPNPLDCPGF